jgi:hypothetical protein
VASSAPLIAQFGNAEAVEALPLVELAQRSMVCATLVGHSASP